MLLPTCQDTLVELSSDRRTCARVCYYKSQQVTDRVEIVSTRIVSHLQSDKLFLRYSICIRLRLNDNSH